MLEENLKILIEDKYGSINNFCNKTGLPPSTFRSILKRGIKNANIGSVITICQELGISADELAHDRIVPIGQEIQKKSCISDIEAVIVYTKRNLKEYDYLSIDGECLNEEEFEILFDAIDIGIGIIKRKRKRELKK